MLLHLDRIQVYRAIGAHHGPVDGIAGTVAASIAPQRRESSWSLPMLLKCASDAIEHHGSFMSHPNDVTLIVTWRWHDNQVVVTAPDVAPAVPLAPAA